MSDEPTRFADVDFSRWPVIVITYPNIASAEAVERMFHEVDERIRAHAEPVVVIGDLTPLRVSTANAKVRRAFAERVAAQGRMHLAGEAAVLRNPVSRGFVTQYKNLLHHYTHQLAERDATTFCGGYGAIKKEAFLAVGGFLLAVTSLVESTMPIAPEPFSPVLNPVRELRRFNQFWYFAFNFLGRKRK